MKSKVRLAPKFSL